MPEYRRYMAYATIDWLIEFGLDELSERTLARLFKALEIGRGEIVDGKAQTVIAEVTR